ncbi:XVIPCD domain-containing protein [Pseudomonas sp. CGJS7]|uniref:XVIPCD domain-containing protein n=1 Tax=Pseudomonas sp. CGJS7 TaxID=3109348 RepID=UPI003008CBF8
MPALSDADTALLDRVNGIGADTVEYANLKQVFADSPQLLAQLRDAVANHGLISIQLLPPTSTLAGGYLGTTGVISLCGANLQRPHNEGAAAASTVGHELRHCQRYAEVRQRIDIDIGFANLLASAGAYDCTDTVQAYVQTMREDEAHAEIAGWNAHLDIVRENIGDRPLTADDLYRSAPGRMAYYVQPASDNVHYEFKPEIQAVLNADLSMPVDQTAIDAVATNYFDVPPHLSGLGPTGACDYRHYYAAAAIAEIRHGSPEAVQLDLSRLQLNETTLRASGADLGPADAPSFIDVPTPPPGLTMPDTADAVWAIPPTSPPISAFPELDLGLELEFGLQQLPDGSAHHDPLAGNDDPGLDFGTAFGLDFDDHPLFDDDAPNPLNSPPASTSAAPPSPRSEEPSDWFAEWLKQHESEHVALPPGDDIDTSTSVLGKRGRDDDEPEPNPGNPKSPRNHPDTVLPQQSAPPHATVMRPQQSAPNLGGTATPEPAAPSKAHPLYQQAWNALQAHPDPRINGCAPETLQRLAGGLACQARNAGMERIDHVVASPRNDNVFAIQGLRPDDPGNRQAHVDLHAAGARPLQQSLAELSAAAPTDPGRTQAAPSQQPGGRAPSGH